VKTTRNFLLVACVMLACAAVSAAVPDIAASAFGLNLPPPSAMDLLALSAIGMTTFTEGNHAGEHISSEASGTRSREVVTLASGNDLGAGTVLGKIRGTASSAALGTNTGNGTMGAVTLGAGALEGAYKLTIIEPAADAGNFVVENPLGAIIGHGTVAVAFAAGGLSFTLADGATDFAAGDSFTITVAAGTKYAAFNQDGTNGTEVAAAVLFDDVDATDADTSCVVHVRDCEVKAGVLVWPADIEAGEKTAALAQLAALGIIAR
jgi:hypothetical protein